MKRIIVSNHTVESSVPVAGSWAGSYAARREVENMIESGCTIADIKDFISELIDQGMTEEDAGMLRAFARETYKQANEMKFELRDVVDDADEEIWWPTDVTSYDEVMDVINNVAQEAGTCYGDVYDYIENSLREIGLVPDADLDRALEDAKKLF